MAVFEIQFGGKTYEVEAPDQSSALRALQGMPGATPPKQYNIGAAGLPEAMREVVGETGAAGRFLAGAGNAARDLYQGGRQLLTEALGSPQAAQGLRKQADADRAMWSPLYDTAAGKVGNLAGNVGLAVLPGSAITTIPRAAAFGGGMGLLQPVGEQDSRTVNALFGAGAGAVGQGAANVLSRVIQPSGRSGINAAYQEMADRLAERGVPLSAAQQTGSKALANLEAAFENIPTTAGRAQAARGATQEGFNKAVTMTFDDASGDLSKEAISRALKEKGGKIGEFFVNRSVPLTDDLMTRLGSILSDVNENTTPEMAKLVQKRIGQLLDKVDSNGAIPGGFYQTWRTQVQQQAEGATDGYLRSRLRDVFKSVDRAAYDSLNKEAAQTLSNLRGQYSALKDIAGPAARTPGGDVSVASLWNAVSKGPLTELRDVAEAGKIVMKQLPDSGTAQRSMYQHFIEHPISTVAMSPGFAAAYGLQSALQSPLGQRYLTNQVLANNPAAQRAIDQWLKGISVGGLLAAPAVAQ